MNVRNCILAVGWGALVLAPVPASASLIFERLVDVSGAGFGAIPRDLTYQQPGTGSPESGCVGIASNGAIQVGVAGCKGADATNDPNGVTPVGGNEPPPPTDSQKYGIPFASALGITQSTQIGLVYNATEQGNESANDINVTDITLKFYRTITTATGTTSTFIGSIDGSFDFSTIRDQMGNGNAGALFKVDNAELAYVQNILNMGNIQFALESTALNAGDGPDSWFVTNRLTNPPPPPPPITPVPEPASLVLLGTGLFAIGRRLHKGHKA